MPQGKGSYGKKKGRPPKKMMGGGMTGMPKMMSHGGATAKAARIELGVGSVGKEVMKKLGLGSGKGPLSNKDKSIAGVMSQGANATKLMKMVNKTKGAISNREMEMFLKASPNLGKKSSPKKKKPIRRGKPGYNRK